MERFNTKLVALLLVLLQIGSIISTPIPEVAPEDVVDEANAPRGLEKRGGARAFYGFYNAGNSKRDQIAALPYYLYEKRGGGRAFNHNANLFRYEKRGGGRAFAGSWSPYLERFYDYKRSGYPVYFADNSYY